jgi:hypothetical protein
VFNGLPVLAMFALGLLAARQKLLAKPEPTNGSSPSPGPKNTNTDKGLR